ncbi:MAG: hypothetical protein WEF53_00345 [Bacteroidota bacterium]
MLFRWPIQITVAVAAILVSCSEPAKESAPGNAEWLKGTTDEKFHAVSRHLRGFDMAMVETGHRYAELYWAGRDQNWPYAKYQSGKIRVAIEKGLERRSKRAASAQTFLTLVLPELLAAIEQQDTSLFWDRFGTLTSTCNACHDPHELDNKRIRPYISCIYS